MSKKLSLLVLTAFLFGISAPAVFADGPKTTKCKDRCKGSEHCKKMCTETYGTK